LGAMLALLFFVFELFFISKIETPAYCPPMISVRVTGEIMEKEAVYTLEEGSTLLDLISRLNLTEEADIEALFLKDKLSEGKEYRIERK